MSFFYTENRIEELLQGETRVVPGPDGAPVSISAFRSLWKAHDFLILFGIHTPESIAAFAKRNSELMSTSFSESFAAVVWNANGHARRILGIDCFAVRPQ